MPNPKDAREAETRLAAMSQELELSTFLNKGVLQTNSELKLRVIELERENKVLRSAETRLAETEDNLEEAEREIQQLTLDRDALAHEWEHKIKDALAAKQGLEAEVQALRTEMKGWRQLGKGVMRLMGVKGEGVVMEEVMEGEVEVGVEEEVAEVKETTRGHNRRKEADGNARTSRETPRDVPRPRETERDRTIRTRTSGPAPALLRGDLLKGGKSSTGGAPKIASPTPNRAANRQPLTPTPVHVQVQGAREPLDAETPVIDNARAASRKRRRRIDDSGSATASTPGSASGSGSQSGSDEDAVAESSKRQPVPVSKRNRTTPKPARVSKARPSVDIDTDTPRTQTHSSARRAAQSYRPATPPVLAPQSSASRRRQDNRPSLNGHNAHKAASSSRPPPLGTYSVKAEPESPTQTVYDSDDDPLAMDL